MKFTSASSDVKVATVRTIWLEVFERKLIIRKRCHSFTKPVCTICRFFQNRQPFLNIIGLLTIRAVSCRTRNLCDSSQASSTALMASEWKNKSQSSHCVRNTQLIRKKRKKTRRLEAFPWDALVWGVKSIRLEICNFFYLQSTTSSHICSIKIPHRLRPWASQKKSRVLLLDVKSELGKDGRHFGGLARRIKYHIWYMLNSGCLSGAMAPCAIFHPKGPGSNLATEYTVVSLYQVTNTSWGKRDTGKLQKTLQFVTTKSKTENSTEFSPWARLLEIR